MPHDRRSFPKANLAAVRVSRERPAISDQLNLHEQLSKLTAKVDVNAEVQKQALAAVEERMRLREEFNKLQQDVNAKFLFLKWTAGALTVVATILGALGYKSINDYVSAARTELTDRL